MNCMAKALCIAIGCDPNELYGFVGATGLEIIWPESYPPTNQRGFHIEELAAFALSKGFALLNFHNVIGIGHPVNGKSFQVRSMLYKIKWDPDHTIIYCGLNDKGIRHCDLQSDNLDVLEILVLIPINK